MITQRDIFISTLLERARKDKDIYFVSVDMGAPSLDQWRSDLPRQFIFAGISEQHAINFSAGLAAAGKKVYIYFMACWVARCFEQIRYSSAMAKNPITILGNGVGLGYAPAGPAHEPNEDIAYMRSLLGIEIYSPANNNVVEGLVHLTVDDPKLRYVRLERAQAEEVSGLYQGIQRDALENGLATIKHKKPNTINPLKVSIVSSGYMLGRAVKVADKLVEHGYETSVIDLWKIKPIDSELFQKEVKNSNVVVTLEEQTLSGGFGSAVIEVLADLGLQKKVLRIGLPERYIFENGRRNYHLDNNGLSVGTISERIQEFLSSIAS